MIRGARPTAERLARVSSADLFRQRGFTGWIAGRPLNSGSQILGHDMLFNSAIFVFLFLPVVLLRLYIIGRLGAHRFALPFLVVVSGISFMVGSKPFICRDLRF